MKVTLNPEGHTPSQLAATAARAQVIVTDGLGRAITLKKPGPLAQFRIVEAVGANSAENRTYMNMVLPLIFVTQIDEEMVITPATKGEIEALIQRLDEEGLAAVMDGVNKHFSSAGSDVEKNG